MDNPYAHLVRAAKTYLDHGKPLPCDLGRELVTALNNAVTAANAYRELSMPMADDNVASVLGEPTV